ncbi:hypothetical protein BSLG_009513 [Batrachochytrium salamandrivorans]|nr:hypothetical protein BSLG_009513 [Batrachochytrium salamandrivorans]
MKAKRLAVWTSFWSFAASLSSTAATETQTTSNNYQHPFNPRLPFLPWRSIPSWTLTLPDQTNPTTANNSAIVTPPPNSQSYGELLTPSSGGGAAGVGFDVAKTGVARVGFVGFPSVGKSTLMSKLTGTVSEVGAYEFTTLTTVPGVIHYKGAKIQMLDLPGIIEGAKDGKGRGRQVIAVARTCSLIFIVLDVLKPLGDKKIIERELEGFGIRLNKTPPAITFKKKEKGGINAILSEYKIHNADISLRCDATADELIDVMEGNRAYIPALYVLNKIDQFSPRMEFDDLLDMMWKYLSLVRIYTKPKGQLPDYSAPVVMRTGKCTVEDFCNSIHKGLLRDFRNALVWGSSVKHNPQKVGKEHIMCDEDVQDKLFYCVVLNPFRNESWGISSTYKLS